MGRTTGSAISHAPEVASYFASSGKQLVTFGGFGELGYRTEKDFSDIAVSILSGLHPNVHIINTGTLIHTSMSAGIAEILRIACSKGFSTSSIHPSKALESKSHVPSAFAHSVFFIEDDGWGRIVGRSGDVSPSLEILLQLSSQFYAIGGGRYTAHELRSFIARGRPVSYFPIGMNRTIADEWHRKAGITNFHYEGDAQVFWNAPRPGANQGMEYV